MRAEASRESEVLMDTFIYDPKTNDGKIVATVKEGSLKVISGLISKKDPDSLTVKVPEGTLGSRGTEFQTIVSRKNKRTDTLLIGPGKNNTLGLRPGAVLVGNKFGNTMLNNPYTFASMTSGKKPGKAKQISQGQLKKFKKRMKALRTAKMEGASKEEKKAIRKKIRKELKEAGLDKEEIKHHYSISTTMTSTIRITKIKICHFNSSLANHNNLSAFNSTLVLKCLINILVIKPNNYRLILDL